MSAPDHGLAVSKTAIDYTIATGLVTAPAWIQLLTQVSALVAAVSGAALGIIRLMIAYREWRDKRGGK